MRRAHRIAGGALATALLAFLACGPPGITRVQPELVAPPAEVDFGAVPVLNVKPVDVPVQNNGRAALKVSSVTLVETGTPFAIIAAPEEVPTSETFPVTVTFTPPEEKDYTATLVIESDDELLPRVEVKLIGKGSTRAIMEVEPETLDFGRVAEGTAAVKSLTVKSSGTADLVLEEIGFVDGGSPAFSFVGSTRTPATVKAKNDQGTSGALQLTVKYQVAAGSTEPASATVKLRGTDPDNREVLVPVTGTVNRAPLADIKPLVNGAPGVEVTLDGSMSSDPDMDLPLTYKWTMRSLPLGSKTKIESDTAAVTKMTLDPELPGEYVVELKVTDSAGASSLMPARVSIAAEPAQKLLVEMFWNNQVTDVDLHFLRTPSSVVGRAPDDCFFQNKTPDWGLPSDASDNPEYLRDALVGYGPEMVGYVNPVNGTYRVVGELAHDHQATLPDSEVTVRVYVRGVVKGEYKKTLRTKGQRWNVVDVEWPSGALTPVPPPDGGM